MPSELATWLDVRASEFGHVFVRSAPLPRLDCPTGRFSLLWGMAWGARFGSGCFGGLLSLLVGFALLPSGCSSESTNNVIGQPDAGQPDTGQPDTGQPDTGLSLIHISEPTRPY